MMYIQSRKRKSVSPLNSQTNWKRRGPNQSEDPNSGASSSSLTPYGGDYEVFLSFRGKDTRKGFTDYLYTSLIDAGIHVFRDDNELRVGEEIDQELFRSIRQSKISIPIISEDYASSKWCLRELAHMLKCKRNGGQIVLPIFYKVKPSQMRHLTGRLGDAINAHKKNLDEMIVKEWEEALEEVTTLKGWESEKIDNGHEGTLVKIVVRKVMRELKLLFQLNVPEQLVGIDDHVQQILNNLDTKFNDTSIIGIYGMGGIGKTTLAKVLYNKLSSHYEYCSFVANIQEISKIKGIECIQKQLISDIRGDLYDVSNVDDGISILKSRFTSKKVLILLDDVDDNTHLNALVKDGSWFKAGSIVIITTRDESILDKARVSHKYQLNELLSDQSLVLFCRHAFRKDSPPSDYEVISYDIVSTTGGLPLALEIIGSFLCGKTKEAWKATSKKLEIVPDKKVQEKLKISYDALDYEDQQIFLDIACFFIGSSKQFLTYMWDACNFFPGKGIEVLSLMSLIKIDKNGELMMHDQLRDLGREIVRQENQKEPEQRSRLWNYEEAKYVLVNNKGTSKIEALCLDSIYGRESYTAETFKELTKLRFLQLESVNLTGDFQNLFPQLRWLGWRDHHSDFKSTNFHLKKLVVLDMSWSGISEDWGGWRPLKMAMELKVLNLSNCALRTTPDLSAFKSLEILILKNCTGLEEIHPSIEDIKTLVSLNVNDCWQLKELPLGVGRMEELRELLIDGTNIRKIPISRGCLMKLETLNASNCSLARLPKSFGSLMSLTQLDLSKVGIKKLPKHIGSLKKLETLNASSCASLIRIPNSIGDLASLSHLDLTNCQKLARLPDSIGSLVSLPQLLLSKCHSLKQIPYSIGKLTSLTELHLKSTAIKKLPTSIGSLKKLKSLDASYCASLTRIPNSIGNLASLSCLNLTNCQELAQLPYSIGSLRSLSQLLLSKCHSLRQIPYSIGKLTSLTKLHLKSTAIRKLPTSIGSLKKLKTLDASYCASLTFIPNSIGNLVSLSHLDLTNCQKLARLPDSIGSLVSLSQLLLSKCHLLKQIPYSIRKLASLTELHLESTAIKKLPTSIGSLKKLKTPNASYCASLAHIPNSIGNLAFLSHLDLTNCKKLAQLPDSIGSLVSLSQLLLSNCHLLRQIPNSIGKLTLLTELHLRSTAIEELPESIGSLKKLKILDASCCGALARIPNSIGNLTSLSHLDLTNCQKLAQLPDSIGSLVSISQLLLLRCHSLRQIPNSIGKLTLLAELHLKSTAIEELPKSIRNMKNLRMLDIGGTPIVELLDDRGILAELQGLRALGWRNLEGLPSNDGQLVSPNNLDLDKRKKVSEIRSRILALVLLKRPKTPPANNSAMDYQTASSEHVLKRSKPFGISDEDSESMADVKPGIVDDSGDKSRNWKLTEINEPSQCRSIRLPDNSTTMMVSRLIYTNSGCAILALSSNAVHKLWKWQENDQNLTGRATTDVVPQLQQPPSGMLMINDRMGSNPQVAVPCFAVSKNDSYLISASGGEISLFNMKTFKRMLTFLPPAPQDIDTITIEIKDSSFRIYDDQVDKIQTKLKGHQRIIKGFAFSTSLNVLMSSNADSQTMTTFTARPPPATFLAFYPQDNNIIAIGMEDSSIQIYNVQYGKFKANLKGHQKRITGLAFSNVLNVLVSSGADSQLCVWSTDGWEKQASRFLQMPTRLGASRLADTRVQFTVDQIHLLVVHETHIATYKATKLECLQQWVTREASSPITDATYSCDGQSIYVSFEDGSIGVLTASALMFRCRISPAAYIPPNPSLRVYPLVIAAHPSDPNQFALGLTDGSVYILEPLECEGRWGTFPPVWCKQFRSTPKVVQPMSLPVKLEALNAELAFLRHTSYKFRRMLQRPPPITTFHSGNVTVGTRPDDRGAPVAAMVGKNSESMADAKPRIAYESGDKSQIWKLTEINEPSQCQSIRLPDILTAKRVSRLIYTNSGLAILALSSNAVHQLWKWRSGNWDFTGRASGVPQLWRPPGGNLMTNDISDTNPEDAVPCFALSKNDAYLISASGGMISLFSMTTFKLMTTFMPPPPAATFLAYLPQDNNIIAIGMEDSSIQIYNVQVDKVEVTLRGHKKRITGLAFSKELNILVSSGTDSQLCVWSTNGWEKQASRFLQMPTGRGKNSLADTRVQFHVDQIHLLMVHGTQIATYEAPNLECLQQWLSQEASGPITDASYSCNGQSVYVSFEDGSISVLTASTLKLRCRINPIAYILSNPSVKVYPLVIAVHPFEPNQFALGLTDGNIYVLEPLAFEREWGASSLVEDGVGPSMTSGTNNLDQPPSPMANKVGLA